MSDNTVLQPLKGFRQLYPSEKVIQSFVLQKAREIAKLYGFEEYDGPMLEPIELYLNKSSRELVEEQSFKVIDKNDKTYLMRPEMTPTLARMIAAKENSLTLPVRFSNIGLRYRYEAPQKGRDREFYQMDFDIIGSNSTIADAEIISIAVSLLKSCGATEKDFVLYINSRETLTKTLIEFGIAEKNIKKVISIIDKRDKVEKPVFVKMLQDASLSSGQIASINNLLDNPIEYEKSFAEILKLIDSYGISEFVKVNPAIVRGLDYYTGIVFEAKSKGPLGRSLLGGGRYDNLVSGYGAKQKLGGVGFATSDSILIAFLGDSNLLPELNSVPSQVFVSIFDESTLDNSLRLARKLRENNIPTEVYPEVGVKLDKQFKYASTKQIPFVAIIGPDEAKNGTVTVKNMNDRTQEKLSIAELIEKLKNQAL